MALYAAPVSGSAALLAGSSVVHTDYRGQQMLEKKLQEQKGKPGFTGLQKYDALKAEALSKKALFEDWEFPAVDESVFGKEEPSKRIKWMRPSEIVKNPEFIVGGADRTDIMQGELGDCWLLAAIASLTCFDKLLENVLPEDQTFTKGYAGIFHFNLWHFGQWLDVVVDDRLPTCNGQLIFMHSRSANEFWSALLEKAYAKLYGSYNALKGGSIGEALEDFTAGMCERIELKSLQGGANRLYEILAKSFVRCSLMGCSIKNEDMEIEGKLENGLIVGHAYSITAIRDLELKNHGKIKLIRIRNPWGDSEWNGPWSDEADEWKQVSDKEKEDLGLKSDNDGEFWMDLDDFMEEWTTVEICHLGPDSMDEDELDGQKRICWEQHIEYGSWRRNANAGGCRNYVDTFWTNPQFIVDITESDDGTPNGNGTLILGLMQKEARGTDADDCLSIGYMLYEYDDKSKDLQNGMLTKRYIQTHKSVDKVDYIDSREVVGRHHLKKGKYVIIISTFEPNEENDFMIRICSEKKQQMKESDIATNISTNAEHDAQKVVQVTDSAMDQLTKLFTTAAGKDGELSAYQLHDFFVQNKSYFKDIKDFKDFHHETCRSMVALADTDCSGKLGWDEFLTMWKNVIFWRDNFITYDNDKSGYFDSFEFRNSLNAIGYVVSNKVFNSIVMRYVNQEGRVTFEDYMLCVIRLKTVFETFKANPKTATGKCEFDLDEFVKMMVYV